ncbi:DUF2573 family protein, partial [Bacillus sp. WP8]|uniref:DUF2573 family protein n=1 Tax=Bacillus sp. WP8 TaxID=756828 RepID=UPI0011A642D2
LLLPQSTHHLKQHLKQSLIYSHIPNTIPPLANHFNQTYPQPKEQIKQTIQPIKHFNEPHPPNKHP